MSAFKVRSKAKGADYVGGSKRSNKRQKKKAGRVEVYGAAYSQLKRDVGMLMRLVNSEDKYVLNDSTSTPAAFSNYLLNGISLGNTSTTRIGQSLKAVRLEMNFFYTLNVAVQDAAIRTMIVLDKQPNGTQFAQADLLDQNKFYSTMTTAGYKRFTILHDEVVLLRTSQDTSYFVSLDLPLNFHVEYYTTNVGNFTDIITNSLWLVLFPSVAANVPTINWDDKFWFVDN